MDVFAPVAEKELNRVLKPGGHLILAVPGRRHLYGLKEILYDAPYENESIAADYEGFALTGRVPAATDLVISGSQMIEDLFAMTPYYYKTGESGAERLKRADMLETEIGFDFLIYEKVGEACKNAEN